MARAPIGTGTAFKRAALACGAIAVALPAAHARAAVVCQTKHGGHVTLRADKCLKKETVVLDLTGTLSTQDAALADQGARLDATRTLIGATCPADPSLTLVASHFVGPRPQGQFVERLGGGCRTLDGNQAACQKSFQNDDAFADTNLGEVASCFYLNGRCFPCLATFASTGGCTNACTGTHVACADPTRTTALGGDGDGLCRKLGNQAECEKAWHVSVDNPGQPPTSCYWNGSQCRGCGANNEGKGNCTNACAPPLQKPPCADATRTTFVRGPDEACGQFDSSQANCLKAYHVGGEGIAAPCWYDTAQTRCRGCGFQHELAGDCTNSCLP
jgi:hypothetical protein